MKLLVVADIHYSIKQYDWLLATADGYDAVIIAGDLLDLAGHAELDTQISVVQRYLRKLSEKTLVFASSGNHDGDVKSEDGEYVAVWLRELRLEGVVVDSHSLAIDNILFTVCPWWDGPRTRDELVAYLAGVSERSPERWVWVYHAPPSDSPVSWTGKKHFGDDLLVELIERFSPAMVVSGHVHNSPYTKDGSWVDRLGSTWCFNPGNQIGPVPAHVILDLDQNTAEWISAYDTEMRTLGD